MSTLRLNDGVSTEDISAWGRGSGGLLLEATRHSKFAAFCEGVALGKISELGICWLHVEPSPTPVYVEEDNNFKFYARLGNTTQPMNPKEMTQYISIRWDQASMPVSVALAPGAD
jgi:hypothetical protein